MFQKLLSPLLYIFCNVIATKSTLQPENTHSNKTRDRYKVHVSERRKKQIRSWEYTENEQSTDTHSTHFDITMAYFSEKFFYQQFRFDLLTGSFCDGIQQRNICASHFGFEASSAWLDNVHTIYTLNMFQYQLQCVCELSLGFHLHPVCCCIFTIFPLQFVRLIFKQYHQHCASAWNKWNKILALFVHIS